MCLPKDVIPTCIRIHSFKSDGNLRSERASDFAPPRFVAPVFPGEFVGCSVPVLFAGPLYSLLSTLLTAQGCSQFLTDGVRFLASLFASKLASGA